MNPGTIKLDTPIKQLMERVESAAKWARSEDDKKLLWLVVQECDKLLSTEREHIEAAWRDGQSGVKHQSGAQYYGATYGSTVSTADLDMADRHSFRPN